MQRTRVQTHGRLTDTSLYYLEHGTASPDLFAVDGLTKDVSPLVVIEARRETRRQDLKKLATHEILPQAMEAEDRAGVAFYDRQDPWLYVVFARKTRSHWRTTNVVELPVQILPPTVMPIGAFEKGPKNRSASWAQTWVTD